MRLSEKLDHILRQYNYKRTRGKNHSKKTNQFNVEGYLAEVDAYIDEVIKGLDEFLPKKGCK